MGKDRKRKNEVENKRKEKRKKKKKKKETKKNNEWKINCLHTGKYCLVMLWPREPLFYFSVDNPVFLLVFHKTSRTGNAYFENHGNPGIEWYFMISIKSCFFYVDVA